MTLERKAKWLPTHAHPAPVKVMQLQAFPTSRDSCLSLFMHELCRDVDDTIAGPRWSFAQTAGALLADPAFERDSQAKG